MRDWSADWNYCRKCISSKNKHYSDGFCKICFFKEEEKKQPNKKIRKCNSCSKSFTSFGFENRRCEECLRKERENAYLSKQSYRSPISE